MLKRGGLGLAANQVGLHCRMFVMAGIESEKLYIINPKIVQKSEISANMKEGCLSAPGEFLILSERAAWVQVDFQDEKGQMNRRVFQSLHAVCVQHEMDNLFDDPAQRATRADLMERLAYREMEFVDRSPLPIGRAASSRTGCWPMQRGK